MTVTMKMKRKLAIFAICGMMAAASSSAQETRTGYFLDNYNYKYKMNPAFSNKYNFVSLPIFGNINLAMSGSMHLTNIFHHYDGRTVLFTNPNIPASCLNDIPAVGKIGADLNLNILSGGFNAFGGYNTVSINARGDMNINVPKSFFELAKLGISNRTYDIHDLYFRATGFGEIAFNHSRDIKQVPGLRAGAAVIFLMGIANIEADLHRAELTLDRDQWIASTNADIYANLGGFQYETDYNNENRPYVSGFNLKGEGSPGVNGFGMAFDFGAVYKWNDFEFSAAVLDLGWLSFFNAKKASTGGTKEFTTDAYTFNANDDADNSFKNEWDRMSDGLGALYELENQGDAGTRTIMPGATLNFGVNYEFPLYRRLNFGFLSSTRFQKKFTWTEARLSANVNPVDCFSASANIAVSNFGFSFGWMVNVYLKGFTIFVGMDHTPGMISKQMIPLNSNMSMNFGIDFPF